MKKEARQKLFSSIREQIRNSKDLNDLEAAYTRVCDIYAALSSEFLPPMSKPQYKEEMFAPKQEDLPMNNDSFAADAALQIKNYMTNNKSIDNDLFFTYLLMVFLIGHIAKRFTYKQVFVMSSVERNGQGWKQYTEDELETVFGALT